MKPLFTIKRISNFITLSILLSLSTLMLSSCEDVVDVNLDNIEPRLVVDASIEWEKGTIGNEQSIQLSQSTNYFNEQFVPVENATVTITNLNANEIASFTHNGNGKYTTTSFSPELNANYQLNITYNGETYQATEMLMPVTPVTKIEQNEAVGFDSENVVSLDFYTNDQPNIQNFYFVKYKRSSESNNYLSVWDDEFRDGNEINFILRGAFTTSEEPLETGEQVNIAYMGISKNYYNYMEILLDQAYNNGGPFSSTPVQVKGNVSNLTNASKNAFGYFYLSEKETFSVTIE